MSSVVLEMDKVVCLEQYGSSPLKRSYSVNNNSEQLTLTVTHLSQKWNSVTQFFRSVFLPQGYPDSVSKDYFEYQIWDTVQAFCSSLTGALATQAVLKGVGVGDESASVIAATMTWILKDGTGMLGRILFAWMQGSYLDCDCKRWRLFADILNDCAIFLEILAPYYKDSFRLIVCISGVGKSIVGVAGGATRAALTQHQARRNNMADVSAKDGSQETLVNLAALICSLFLIPMVTGHESMIWGLFLLFTGLHLYSNYKAVTAVSIETFNQTRLHLVCQLYLKHDSTGVPSVNSINKQEPVLWSLRRRLKIHIGVSVGNIITRLEELQKLTQIFKSEKYLLNINLRNNTIYIGLHSSATIHDQLKACFQAEVLEYAFTAHPQMEVHSKEQVELQRVTHSLQQGDHWSALSQSYSVVSMVYARFQSEARASGWTLSDALLCANEWRAQWDGGSGLDLKKHF